MEDKRLLNVPLLEGRFSSAKADGLQDLKFCLTKVNNDTTLDDLCAEAMEIIDLLEKHRGSESERHEFFK